MQWFWISVLFINRIIYYICTHLDGNFMHIQGKNNNKAYKNKFKLPRGQMNWNSGIGPLCSQIYWYTCWKKPSVPLLIILKRNICRTEPLTSNSSSWLSHSTMWGKQEASGGKEQIMMPISEAAINSCRFVFCSEHDISTNIISFNFIYDQFHLAVFSVISVINHTHAWTAPRFAALWFVKLDLALSMSATTLGQCWIQRISLMFSRNA